MACSHVHAPPALTAWTVLEYLMSYSLYCLLMGIQRNKTKVNKQISDNAGLLEYYNYHACTPHAIGVFLSSFYMYLIICFWLWCDPLIGQWAAGQLFSHRFSFLTFCNRFWYLCEPCTFFTFHFSLVSLLCMDGGIVLLDFIDSYSELLPLWLVAPK